MWYHDYIKIEKEDDPFRVNSCRRSSGLGLYRPTSIQ